MALRIWRRDFDALIAYQPPAALLVGIVGRLAGCRLRIVHQTRAPSEMRASMRWLDRLAGMFGLYSMNIVNSASIWAEFSHYPVSYRRSMVPIAYGLNAPVRARRREDVRRVLGLPLSQPIILNVGRLVAQKNQDLLIRVIACLPQVHLVLAGSGRNERMLRTLAATLGVAERVHIFGSLPALDIADLYVAADLFAFPATQEYFGLEVVEAAVNGVPIVAADLPALREELRIDGSEPVVYIEPRDLEGWINSVDAALAQPQSLGAVTAFAHAICRKFPHKQMIENYLSLFDGQPFPGRRRVRRSNTRTALESGRP